MSKYYANMTITYMEDEEYKCVAVGDEVPEYVINAWRKQKKGSETGLDVRLRAKHIVLDKSNLDDVVVDIKESEKENIISKTGNNSKKQTTKPNTSDTTGSEGNKPDTTGTEGNKPDTTGSEGNKPDTTGSEGNKPNTPNTQGK